VEKDARRRLGDGDGLSRGVGDQGRNRKFREVGGFFFDGALEVDAGFIGGPLDDAEANAETSDFAGSAEIANFEDFLVEIVGDFGAGGREGDAAGEGVQGGDLGGILREEFETLKARGAVEVAVAFDGDGGIAAEMRATSRKVRPSKAFPAGPVDTLRYFMEKRARGATSSVRYTRLALSRSQRGLSAFMTRGSLPPGRSSWPESSRRRRARASSAGPSGLAVMV